jgi:catechol 2,3-dioxygenase-like lactoylglutathione lyase family enzyme
MNPSPFTESVTFLYTADLQATASFYEQVLGLELVVDQGDCRIYRVSPESFLGFCQRALPPAGQTTGVIFTFVTENVDGWAGVLRTHGVEIEKNPAQNEKYKIYNLFFRDPNGYLMEIQRFDDPEWKTPAD